MKIYYFAWKNGEKADKYRKQEWTELTAKEYKAIYEDNKTCDIGKRRFFERVPGAELVDDIYYFECDYEQYKKYRAEKEKKARKEKQLKEDKSRYGAIQVLSLDAEYEEASGKIYSLHDMIADENSLFENRLIESIDLKNALCCLSPDEIKILDLMFFNEEKPVSDMEMARKLNIPRRTFGYQKEKIFNKLKKSFATF